MGLLTPRPKQVGSGLLKPVIWDKVRREGRLPTEGAGGAGGGWTPRWDTSGGWAHTRTPAGNTVSFYRDTTGRSAVTFTDRVGKGTTARAIGRFSDVYRAFRSYVKTYKPRTIEFTGATEGHNRVYDRVVPQVARELGGTSDKNGGVYRIFLPESD